MRKVRIYIRVTAILLLVLDGSLASAQEGLRLGMSLGIQNTQLTSTYRSEIDVKNAFCPQVSADIEYGLSPLFAIQTGMGYAVYSQNTSKFRNNFSYLTTPLYLKFGGFRKQRKFALSFFGGPNFKFLLAASNLYQDEKYDIRDYSTNFHLDYTLGVGLKYQLNDYLVIETHLTATLLGGSFNHSTTDLFFLKNTNFGAILGFRYHIKLSK